MLRLAPVDFATAKAFIAEHHRHHDAPVSWKFGVGVYAGESLVGVGIAGRPVSRVLDDGTTVEITRICTVGHKNTASKLYSALRRAALALGYRRLITYTLASESGVSLRAAGWNPVKQTKGGTWDTPARRRGEGLGQLSLIEARKPRQEGRKVLWESI